MWIIPDTILTMAGDPLEGHAVLIDGERIADIIPTGQVPQDAEVHMYTGSICFPAFVNLHTHLFWSNWRGIGDDLPLSEWIYDRVVKVVLGANDGEKQEGIELGITRSFEAGITTVLDSHLDDSVFKAAIEKGLRGIFFLEGFGIYNALQGNEIKRVKRTIEEMLKDSTSDQRVGFSPHASYTVTPTLLKNLVPWAREKGLPLATHLAETEDERRYFAEGKGKLATKLRISPGKPDLKCSTPVEYYSKYNLFGPDMLLAHCVDIDSNEINRIADSGSRVVTCPTSNAKLACGIAPVMAMVDAGIDVGLGTDSEASSDEFDMFEEMRRLMLLQRGSHRGIGNIDGKAALEMCTSRAARIAGFNDIGTIEVGRAADLVVVNVDTSGVSSYRDHYNRLVWGAHKSDIRLVLSRGSKVFERGVDT